MKKKKRFAVKQISVSRIEKMGLEIQSKMEKVQSDVQERVTLWVNTLHFEQFKSHLILNRVCDWWLSDR